MTLAAAGTAVTPDFVDIPPGTGVDMARGTDFVLVATAADDDGVSSVELWINEARTCDHGDGTATQSGPGLVGVLAARTDGEVIATDAPSSLITSTTISGGVPANCVYRFEMWIVGANAADTAVISRSNTATFVLRGGG